MTRVSMRVSIRDSLSRDARRLNPMRQDSKRKSR